MRTPALVPAHVPLAEAARIAERHGFVLESVVHEGRVRIAMVRRAHGGAAERRPTPPVPAPPGATVTVADGVARPNVTAAGDGAPGARDDGLTAGGAPEDAGSADDGRARTDR